ncbi:D-2-hydroxyacid dehydrogenase [Vibrio sp. JPW-9-11-11]|uniref:D-2-hydroxyacid dehydrogenase n=1 Tax=Vibrio sp. JPW-9-11-11 TaxID=1416532 RepID=UPI001593D11E|nr:D-2-hydroxyacid dehydrogenase [Vibrio sp. JPW-9-11-11]NVD05417.1 D-2-hydroxyacid dehydrogenase [Vibrio sp. JPW-9-11-11]
MNNFTHKVYLLTEDNDKYRQLLEQASLPQLALTEQPCEATILLASPPKAAKRIQDFPHVEWIQSIYAGVDALIPALNQFDGQLTNVKGIFGQQIAEYVIGYSIAHYRHFNHYLNQQAKSEWSPLPYSSLSGKKVVILGTGSIGAELAQAIKSLAMQPIGVNRSGIPAKHSPFSATYHIQELATALTQADIVVNTLPNTAHTQQILNQSSLAACQQALLFNVGRGSAIDELGLLTAIESGAIEHAFLDVFEQEPLPQSHPFWSHPKITVTPHIAALSFPEQVVDIFADNYQRWCDGFGLVNQIDLDKGY